MVRAFLLVCRRLSSHGAHAWQREREWANPLLSLPLRALIPPQGPHPHDLIEIWSPSKGRISKILSLEGLERQHVDLGKKQTFNSSQTSFHLQIPCHFSLLVEILKPLLVPKFCHVGVMKKKKYIHNIVVSAYIKILQLAYFQNLIVCCCFDIMSFICCIMAYSF